MNTEVVSFPADLALCHAMMAQMHEQLVSLQRSNEQLEHRLDVLLRRMFGPRSERVDPNQLALFTVSAEETMASPPPAEPSPPVEPPPSGGAAASKPKPNSHGRRPFPEKLPRRRIPVDIPEAEKTCPCCGKQRKVIGEVITERLGFEPAQYYVNQYVQLKYGCDCERSGVVTAEKPIQPIEKGNAEPELAALVAVSRFDDHSPYYRQENGQFRRAGIDIARSTQSDWMRRIAELCLPLYELMHILVLRSKVLGTDATRVPVLVPGRGTTQEAQMWGYRGDHHYPFNVFDFTMTHARAGPLGFLRRDETSKAEDGFRGYLQADAHSVYDAIVLMDGIVEVGCWAHTRRKFYEAKGTNLAVGMESLARIRQLYEVEAAARAAAAAAGAGAAEWPAVLARERLALRQERAVPLLGSLKVWLDGQYGRVLPKSAMGEAIGYALGNWQALLRYTEDGDIPIDNNAVERMLKIIALGRKNWLFAGSERGGRTAAVLFTLISSAKRHRLNTWAYLRDVLWRLADLKPRELEELLPDRWRDSRAS